MIFFCFELNKHALKKILNDKCVEFYLAWSISNISIPDQQTIGVGFVGWRMFVNGFQIIFLSGVSLHQVKRCINNKILKTMWLFSNHLTSFPFRSDIITHQFFNPLIFWWLQVWSKFEFSCRGINRAENWAHIYFEIIDYQTCHAMFNNIHRICKLFTCGVVLFFNGGLWSGVVFE